MNEQTLKLMKDALEDRKGFDVKILKVDKITSISDYFVIASGNNKNQIQAMCDSVEEAMHKAGIPMRNREGHAMGGWILLDYYDAVVHIFTTEMREFYNLDRTWSDAEIIA